MYQLANPAIEETEFTGASVGLDYYHSMTVGRGEKLLFYFLCMNMEPLVCRWILAGHLEQLRLWAVLIQYMHDMCMIDDMHMYI